ncbi:DUF2567 domain-containing protein [Nocardia jinanensis]|uniref:DUF2567 domain-containing protein n=1 Tax=Nocardia jinanensis TaxID=382504 RepID=A0A917RE52_9NOCA|nr:DUF2567 domain-containing protein [Nocardia jinanensis]GGL03846.1 hypothetical protein GCM10011588_18100 [Nocardia jinanensis]
MPGRSRAGTRRELRAALVLLFATVLVSLLVGALWGLLAPTERVLVVEPGRGAALVGESLHRFDATALFAGAGAVTGFLSAVAAWRWRRMRGPIQCAGLLLGSAAGAWVMAWIGDLVVTWDNPRPDDPPVGRIVALPVELGSQFALVVQPLLAGLVILILAGLSPAEDLGTGFASPFGDSRPQPYADPERVDAPYQPVPPGPAPTGDPARAGAPAGPGGHAAGDSPEAPPSSSA